MARKNTGYSYEEFCERLLNAVGEGNVKSFSDFKFHETEDFYFDIDCSQTKNKKNIIMRHDVDHDPVIARNLAKVEKEMGVRSTFFALTGDKTSGSWAWWVDENKRKQFIDLYLEIQDMGHEVGLHYDFLGDYFDLSKDPKENAEEILSIFRSSGLEIYGCASHGSGQLRKMIGAVGSTPYPVDFVNYVVWEEVMSAAVGEKEKYLQLNSKKLKIPCMSLASQDLLYEAYSVRKEWYLSDSGGDFWLGGRSCGEVFENLSDSDKDPFAVAENNMEEGEIMQILVHPIWWRGNMKK